MKVILVSESFTHKNSNFGDVTQVKRLEWGLNEVGVEAKYIPIVGDEKDSPVFCNKINDCDNRCISCPTALEQSEGHLERLVNVALSENADIYHIRRHTLFNLFPDTVNRVITAFSKEMVGKAPAGTDKETFNRADASVSINKGTYNYFKSKGIDTEIVPVCANLHTFNPDCAPHQIADKLKGKKVIGYIGGLQSYQIPPALFEALSILNNTGLPTHLIIVTHDQLKMEQTKKFCDSLGISDNVSFFLNVPNDEVGSIIKVCDVMFLLRQPYNAYPLTPMKLLDYMAMNKPFIYAEGDLGVEEVYKKKEWATTRFFSDFVNNLRLMLLSETDCNLRDVLIKKGYTTVESAKKALEVYGGVLNK